MLELLAISRARLVRSAALAAAITAGVLQAGCTVTLVQPYDEKLFDDTEAFYKEAAGVIDEGIAASPLTDAERSAIAQPVSKHPAHFSAFAPKYDALLNDADALLLRGTAGSGALDAAGESINKKIEKIIDDAAAAPATCKALQDEFAQVASLTVKNYVDLKCLLVLWRAQHSDSMLTQGTLILKKANWEGRKLVLFEAVLAIQKAEGFKKDKGK